MTGAKKELGPRGLLRSDLSAISFRLERPAGAHRRAATNTSPRRGRSCTTCSRIRSESNNIYAERQALGDRMNQELRRARGADVGVAASTPKAAVEVDPEARERLAALGYVGTFVTTASPDRAGLADPKDKIQLFNLMTQAREIARHDKESDEGLRALQRVVDEDPKVIDAWFMMGNQYYRRHDYTQRDRSLQARAGAEARLRPRRHQHGERLSRARARSGSDGRLPPLHGARSEERADPLRGGADSDRQRQARRRAGGADARAATRAEARRRAQRARRARAAPRRSGGRRTRNPRGDCREARRAARALQPRAARRSSRGTCSARSPNTRKRSSCTPTATRRRSISGASTDASAIGAAQIDATSKAIEINPSFAEGHLFLAKLYLDADEHLDEAVRLARRGLELAPESEYAPLGHYVIADMLLASGTPRRSRAGGCARPRARTAGLPVIAFPMDRGSACDTMRHAQATHAAN